MTPETEKWYSMATTDNELFLTEKHAHEAIKSAEAIIQWADNLMNNPENQ